MRSRARLIFDFLVLIRSHYTIWEPGTGYAWMDLSDLDDPLDSTFVKYKSGHGMATPELMEAHNDDNVVDINSVSLSEFTSIHY